MRPFEYRYPCPIGITSSDKWPGNKTIEHMSFIFSEPNPDVGNSDLHLNASGLLARSGHAAQLVGRWHVHVR